MTIKENFSNEIRGYHLINSAPIKESVWEEINCNIVNKILSVTDKANGNHVSGKDNKYHKWNISNKSTKIDCKLVKISSYRLTSVCTDKEPGEKEKIIDEIESRDKSFDYYSILLRKEEDNYIEYNWYIIPKDYYIFKIDKDKFITLL